MRNNRKKDYDCYFISNISSANVYKIFDFVLVGPSGNVQTLVIQNLIGPLLAQ